MDSSSRIQALTRHLTAAAAAAGHANAQQQEVLYHVSSEGIAILTLNRPERGNAFTESMQELYFDLLDRANADPAVKAILVTGSGKQFCVGADKGNLADITESRKTTLKRDVMQIRGLETSKPLVCVINGACAGLGLVLALMCDVRFAVDGAKFTTAFAKRGLVAEHGIAWILPRVVGISRAADLLLSARVVLSQEAYSMGMINFIRANREDCMRDALAYTKEMIRFCSPAAMAEMKRQLYGTSWGLSPREECTQASGLMVASFQHPDFEQGVKSLTENKDPAFKGLQAGRIRDFVQN